MRLIALGFVVVAGLCCCTQPPPAPAAEDDLDKRGCCSHHGGVCGCNTFEHKVTCCDGAESPTCTCRTDGSEGCES